MFLYSLRKFPYISGEINHIGLAEKRLVTKPEKMLLLCCLFWSYMVFTGQTQKDLQQLMQGCICIWYKYDCIVLEGEEKNITYM